MFATDWNARGMNLGKGWIGKQCAPFVSTISGCDIAAACVGREIKHVSVSARGEYDGVRRVAIDFSCAQTPRNNSLRLSINDHQIQHLGLWNHPYGACGDLPA